MSDKTLPPPEKVGYVKNRGVVGWKPAICNSSGVTTLTPQKRNLPDSQGTFVEETPPKLRKNKGAAATRYKACVQAERERLEANSRTPILTDEKRILFEKRYQEGYDIPGDLEYEKWVQHKAKTERQPATQRQQSERDENKDEQQLSEKEEQKDQVEGGKGGKKKQGQVREGENPVVEGKGVKKRQPQLSEEEEGEEEPEEEEEMEMKEKKGVKRGKGGKKKQRQLREGENPVVEGKGVEREKKRQPQLSEEEEGEEEPEEEEMEMKEKEGGKKAKKIQPQREENLKQALDVVLKKPEQLINFLDENREGLLPLSYILEMFGPRPQLKLSIRKVANMCIMKKEKATCPLCNTSVKTSPRR